MIEAADDAREALRTAALGPHTRLTALLTEVEHTQPTTREPRRRRELADTFMATASRHLAAFDDTLLPVAREGLSGGHHLVAGYVHHARELEQALHAVKAYIYGDVNARSLSGEALWAEMRDLLTEHDRQESLLVDEIADVLSADDQAALAGRLTRTEERAPTRPHPYTPHTGALGRLVHRAWRVFDGFWDSAEGRVIPHREAPPHPRRNSLLTRYVMGTPRFDPRETEERGRP